MPTELQDGQAITRRIGSLVITLTASSVIIRGYRRHDRASAIEVDLTAIATLASKRDRNGQPLISHREALEGLEFLRSIGADPGKQPEKKTKPTKRRSENEDHRES